MMQPRPSSIDAVLVLEALGFGAFLFDRQGKVVFVNEEAMRIGGHRSVAEAIDQLEGRATTVRVVQLATGEPARPARSVQRALVGEAVTEDLERIDPPGQPHRIVRASFRPVRDRDGEIVGVLKTVRDVTLEYELARRKDEFVRVTAHELRTPATTLRLRAQQLLRDGPACIEHLGDTARAIDRATRRIETLATKLHDIATVAAGQPIALRPASLRLDELVGDVVRSLAPAQERRIRTTTAPAEVRADPIRMREVVEALLDNALRYSEPPAAVAVSVAPHEGEVELSVADQGIGIPPASREHLFEQFYRAHGGTAFDRGGLGISLYLAYRIVEQHGGRMWFESTERAGSTFHVALRACA